MRKFTIMLALMSFIGLQAVLAQKTITGTVTGAADGGAIPGASVVVQGTTNGTTTDLDGNYKLTVADNAKALEFSFVGMIKKVIPIGASNVINVVLESEVMDIEGVVVTALGISREKKTLGYAVQDVKGDELSRTNEGNIVNTLSGKVAGVQVTNSSGAVGSSSRITIRGNSSFGNNQPLFVVDGTPISNSSSSVSQWGGTDFGNAAADIDPENIESVSILKGANAAALYGSRAANGVVLITTKKGKSSKKGLGITFSSSVDFSNVNILPDYQDKYGQGSIGSEYYAKLNGVDVSDLAAYNEYAVNNAYSYGDGQGLGVRDYVDESWGPRLDIGLNIPQFTSPWLDANGHVTTDPAQFAEYQATPWVSHPDNVRDFFETGVNQKYNVALSSSSEKGSARLSISNTSQEGTIPNTDLTKTSVNFASSLILSEKLTASFNGTYVNNSSDNLPQGGYDATNVMQSIGGWFGRQVDMNALESHWDEMDPFGKPYTWSYYYHDSPYWTVNKKVTSRDRNRFFGNFKLDYKLNDWMTLSARAGTDFYSEKRKFTRFEMSNANKNHGGDFWQNERTNQETNLDMFLVFDKKINDDLRFDGVLGTNYRNYKYNYSSLTATELTVPNFFDISNVSGNATTDMYKEEKETNSVFGEINLSYRDFLFLGATARNDWSSTLPTDNNSFFYPSVSLGFIFTEAFDLPEILSFGKARISYAQVGNDTDPYKLTSSYSSSTSTFYGVTQYFYARQLANAHLNPEITTTMEGGLELKFLNNRAGMDVTYYDKVTTDQIMAVDIAASTGFTSKFINAGEIENKGVELMLYYDILKNKDGFNWTINVNWAKNENVVNELYGDLEAYQISSSWGGVTIEARPGETFGVIKGGGYARDDNGNILVNASGRPYATPSPVELGNITPDWTGGVRNTFGYKGISLSVLLDGRKGGDIFSVTKMFGLYAGILDETAQGDIRENGVIAGQNVMTDETFVTEDGAINDITTSAAGFYKSFYGIKEESIVDGSFIKLREITLGYDVPKNIVKKTGFIQGLNLSVYGRNLALLYHDKSNDIVIDPETGFGTSNDGMGIEQYQLPSSRTIGFKLTAKF